MSPPVVKTFNTTGPCVPDEHYMLPSLPRQEGVEAMIEGKKYFILHAPRQSGKTTFLEALTHKINSEAKYYALTCSLMGVRNKTEENQAITAIISLLNIFMNTSQVECIRDKAYLYNNLPGMNDSEFKIGIFLNRLCEALDKDLVIFFDEADCLSGPGLISFLAQIRDFYQIRHQPRNKFPRSMALVGLRDIKDYQSTAGAEPKGPPPSPFNIKEGSFTLPNFTQEDIGILYRQHTEASGQVFEDGAIERAWHWSEGQPWLVNALAKMAVESLLNKDFSQAVTAEIVDQAARAIISSDFVHTDSLMERLAEPRVRRVMDAVIVGAPYFDSETISDEDIQYVLDLGILKSENEVYKPANPIYNEIILRKLTKLLARKVPKSFEGRWVDGQKLDMNGLLMAFQKYWRENSEMLGDSDRLNESTPHLVCFTFIQKSLNGYVEEINREYALGRKRVDLHALYKGVSYPIELKTQTPDRQFTDRVRENSLEQLHEYMDKCGSKIGWLVVFDLDYQKCWQDKITWNTIEHKGSIIHIVGC
jgi:hypothetical protein